MGKPAMVKDETKELMDVSDYEQYASQGFENTSKEDYSIPFLQVLQGLSPQLQENEELRQGMIFNTVTGEAFSGKTGIVFVPATTQHLFVEWKPLRGGFVATYEPDSEEVLRAKRESTEYGKFYIGEPTIYEGKPLRNDLVETYYVYGVQIESDGTPTQVVIGFSSTKIKKYRAWMTKARSVQITLPNGTRVPAPLFAHRYRLTTVPENNKKGDYYNWNVSFDGNAAIDARISPKDPVFQAALKVKELMDQGKAKAAYDSERSGSEEVF